MKKFFANILGLALLSYGAVSCSDFLDQYSQDLVVAKSVTDLNELLVGDVYIRSSSVSYGMGTGILGFVNMLDDDINTTGTSMSGNIGSRAWTASVQPLFGFFAWQQDVRYNNERTGMADDASTWNGLYRRINHANNIVDIIDEMPRNTDDEKALYHRVKGEAHFLRAQFYFALANLYGKPYRPDSATVQLCVPLKLTPHVEHDKDKATQFTRATVAEVYDQIIKDLTLSVEHLTTSPQLARFRLHRASADAASLLLSRVYLYAQQWEKAEVEAKKVMDSPLTALSAITDLKSDAPFLTRYNKEVIFSQGANYVAPKDLSTSLSADPADYCVTRDLYNLYEADDARKSAFFAVNGLTDSIRLTQKYERGLELNHISDGFLLRTAEAYLNYAEACAMQGKATEANQALHALRKNRIHYYTPTDLTGEALVDAIRNERRRELCFEGHRWFDLRRYAINEEYPYKKDIIHAFSVYSNTNAYLGTNYYLLPSGDDAYTFSLPVAILEFDKEAMPDNYRPPRKPIANPIALPSFDDDEETDSIATP